MMLVWILFYIDFINIFIFLIVLLLLGIVIEENEGGR